MEIRCLIVDDEEPARDELSFFLSKLDFIKIAGEANSVKSAFEKAGEIKPDLIFLDIEMPGHNGFFLVEKLKTLNKIPHIIFVTAYDQYAVKAFEADAVDYILKPFSFERIESAAEKVGKRIKDSFSPEDDLEKITNAIANLPTFSKIPLEKNGRMLLVSPEEIRFFESFGKEIQAELANETLKLSRDVTMEKLEQRLYSKNFFRSHRSYLVNLNHIVEYYSWFGGKYELVMDDKGERKIPVSRNRVKEFKKRILI